MDAVNRNRNYPCIFCLICMVVALTPKDPHFALALRIARWAAAGNLPDITGAADHYHSIFIAPKWAAGQTLTAVIGRHVFYRLEV